jgi:hypothetical protein
LARLHLGQAASASDRHPFRKKHLATTIVRKVKQVVLDAVNWPVLKCPQLAGFDVIPEASVSSISKRIMRMILLSALIERPGALPRAFLL